MSQSVKTSYGSVLLVSCLILVIALVSQARIRFENDSLIFVVQLPRHNKEIVTRSQLAALEGAGSSLAGWWEFSEGSGTYAFDTSGGGQRGVLTGGVSWTAGKIGGALDFDGTDDHVKIGAYDVGGGTITSCAWIYPTAMSGSRSIFGDVSYVMFINDGTLKVTSNGFTTFAASASNAVSANSWQYVCAARSSSGTASLYVNGALSGAPNQANAISTSAFTAAIGTRGSAAAFSFQGKIDDVRLYSRELSGQEISDLYNQGLAGGPALPTDPDPTPPQDIPSVYSISVSRFGSGTGAVSGGSINCGGVCMQSGIAGGSAITLAATPDSGSTFTGWSGGGCSGQGACNIIVNSNITVDATFNAVQSAQTNTYWVSPTGQAAWSGCKSDTPLNGNQACSVATANLNAAAGDRVNFRGGTYSFSSNYIGAIDPKKSGTANKPIIFSAYSGETPVFTQTGGIGLIGLSISGQNYIKIDGLVFRNFDTAGSIINYAHHNEILNSKFYSDTGVNFSLGYGGVFILWDNCGGSGHGCNPTHNWIHHNYFSKAGTDSSQVCFEGSDSIRIGQQYGYGGNGAVNYNTIENNYVEYSGHSTISNFGEYTVIRNNVLNNAPWKRDSCSASGHYTSVYENSSYNGKYGHRNLSLLETYGRQGTYVLVEGNRIGYASTNPNNDGAENLTISAPMNIFRYNYLYGAMNRGIYFKWSADGQPGQGGNASKDNRIYNNTVYRSGYGYSGSPQNYQLNGVLVYSGSALNVLKNNIVYGSRNADISDPSNRLVIDHNWETSNGDPKFVNPDLSQVSSTYLPNLSLQSNSPVINQGTHLTQTIGSGSNSTSLSVKDAMYFQDGSWGSDLVRMAGTFQADWIAVGSVSNVAQISSVNYSANTITLRTPISWSNNAPVWLYKDSSGRQVLFGSAPDIGAHEYSGAYVPPPPSAPLCSFSLNSCQSGSLSDTADSDTEYLWSCQGPTSSVACSLSKTAEVTPTPTPTITPTPTPIILPPGFSSLNITNITTTGAQISWTTANLSVGWIEYGLTSSYGNTTPPSTFYDKYRLVNLTNLLPNTIYHYRIRSRDYLSVNVLDTADQTFTTLSDKPTVIAPLTQPVTQPVSKPVTQPITSNPSSYKPPVYTKPSLKIAPLLATTTTEYQDLTPQVPSWMDVILNFFQTIVSAIGRGVGYTWESVKGVIVP